MCVPITVRSSRGSLRARDDCDQANSPDLVIVALLGLGVWRPAEERHGNTESTTRYEPCAYPLGCSHGSGGQGDRSQVDMLRDRNEYSLRNQLRRIQDWLGNQ